MGLPLLEPALKRFMSLALEKLNHKFYLHARSKWDLSYPEGAANVQPTVFKYLFEELRSTVGDQVLLRE